MYCHKIAFPVLVSLFIVGCGSQLTITHAEKNKELVKQFFNDIDNSNGSIDFINDWLASDFKMYLNGANDIDLEEYRQVMADSQNGFPDKRHEIKYMIAEGDRVAVQATVHMKHSNEYAGIAPTGRIISVEEIMVLRFKEGKITEEWILFDFAGLYQQLEAPNSVE